MIYLTGDTHGDFRRFSTGSFPEQKEMDKNDYVIICGDFGGIWDWQGESREEKYWLDWLENKSFTTLFVDGNHENFKRLYKYPQKSWNNGFVNEIRPSILHLQRGNIFYIDGISFFAFGGARSHDIQGGILEPDDPYFTEKRKRLERQGICFRINKVSWWEEEMPSEQEMAIGLMNLKKNKNKVDFIITHDCPASTLALFGHGTYKPDELNQYLEELRWNLNYKKWFFGHYHDNRNVADKEIMIYEQIIRIA